MKNGQIPRLKQEFHGSAQIRDKYINSTVSRPTLIPWIGSKFRANNNDFKTYLLILSFTYLLFKVRFYLCYLMTHELEHHLLL